jgi:hypothetical protein
VSGGVQPEADYFQGEERQKVNEAILQELEDPDTLLVARLPMDARRFAAIARLFDPGEAVVKAMPAGCRWTVIKRVKKPGRA